MKSRNRRRLALARPANQMETRQQNNDGPAAMFKEGIRIDGDHLTTEPPQFTMTEETYARERTCLIEIEQKSADQHDKAILTLTSGALALSITFLDKIAASPLPNTVWIIGVSWLCYVLAIAFILWSFLTSQKACRRQRELLDIEYSTATTPDQTNRPALTTHRLNVASYWLFVAGTAFLATFSWINLAYKGDKAQQQSSRTQLTVSSPVAPSESAQRDDGRGTVSPASSKASTTPTNNSQPSKN